MQRFALLVSLVLILTISLAACGGSDEPAQPTPTEPPPATAVPPTEPPPLTATPAPTGPTLTPVPTPTPLSLSDVSDEFRTFINEAYDYAIQIPTDWEITPRGAGHADRIEVAAPGPDEIRGANTIPPLVFSISVLDSEAGYANLDDVQEDRSFGNEALSELDIRVNGLRARRIQAWGDVYGTSLYYIIQRDGQFFVIHAYGYNQPSVEPVVNTFGPPPDLTRDTAAGQIQSLDIRARTMTVVTESGGERQVAWFTDTEVLPAGRLEGHIDAGDRVSAEGILLDSGEIQAATITLQVPQGDDSEPVLEFRRTGGVAGFDDVLVIFDDGTARLQQGTSEPVEIELSEAQWEKVENYVVIFEPFAWHQQDDAGGPDNLVTDLDFYGAGEFDAVFDNQEEIVNYLQELLTSIPE
ncbi:MAG: hypothetical protein MAG451_00212 [Anaerolineales bacterium]|nr:hypothetical protein [Anaerolineales bacterium]